MALAVIAIAIVGAVSLLRRRNESGAGGGEPPREDRDRASEEERWQQALEEIAFDRARGVLGEGDYAELRARYEAALDGARRQGAEKVAAVVAPDGGPPPRTESTIPAATVPHPSVPTPILPLPSDDTASSADTASTAPPSTLHDAAEELVARARANRVTCSTCGTRPEPGARFCSTCGRALAPCANCGAADHAAGARFCASCGAALT